MPVQRVMEEVSYKEYRCWIYWLIDEWNRPTRSDHYLMMIGQEVRRVLAKKKRSIKLEHFRLNWPNPFKKKPKTLVTQPLSQAELAKQVWKTRLESAKGTPPWQQK